MVEAVVAGSTEQRRVCGRRDESNPPREVQRVRMQRQQHDQEVALPYPGARTGVGEADENVLVPRAEIGAVKIDDLASLERARETIKTEQSEATGLPRVSFRTVTLDCRKRLPTPPGLRSVLL